MKNVAEISTTLQSVSDDLGHALKRVSTSIVAINARRHLSSSGVHWQKGVIVTAAHTIKRTEDISVVLPSGQRIAATLAGADPSTDLAVLRAQSPELSVPNFADASQLKVGHLVIAAGRGAQRGFNAALGIVGVVGGAWRSLRGGLVDQFIALNLELHPAAAGGALVDARGFVLGINTPALSRNFPLALPASTVNRVVARLLEKGTMGRGYLGLGMRPVRIPEDLVKTLQLTADVGLMIANIDAHGPGSKTGIVFGDVIVALEGKPIGSIRELQAFLEPESVGKPLSVSVIRGGKLIGLKLVVGEQTQRNEPPPSE